MTNKLKLYWTLQFTGWAIYILVNYLALPLFDTELPYSGLYFFFSLINGISVTHLYRRIIKEYQWFDLPILKLIRNIFLGSVGITILYFFISTAFDILVFIFSVYILKINYPTESVLGDNYWALFYLSLINVYAVFLLWTVLYFVFQYFEKFQQSKYQQLLIQSQLNDVRLQNLRNQINPHFLFNALNSIKALTLIEADKARNAVTLLSEILRYSLSSEQKSFVTLKEELSVVKDYLELEKIRFGNRLNYQILIDEKLNDTLIPPLVLMTLVENAIKHGISSLKSGGDVLLNAEQIGDTLKIEIINTGVLSEIENPIGIGLKNTQQRLQMLYKKAATCIIEQRDINTVSATVQIPLTNI